MTPHPGSWIEIMGFCAALQTTFASTPQLWRVLHLRSGRRAPEKIPL